MLVNLWHLKEEQQHEKAKFIAPKDKCQKVLSNAYQSLTYVCVCDGKGAADLS